MTRNRMGAGRGPARRRAGGIVLACLALVALAHLGKPACAAAAAADSAAAPAFTEEDRRLCLESFDHVWTTIRDRHFDPTLGGIDWQAVRDSLRPRVERASSTAEARRAMRQAIAVLGQSHFQIIPADVLRARGRPPGQGSPGGTTGMDVRVVEGRALVTQVEPGSPADSQGVRPGWEIVRAGGEDIAPLVEVVARADSAVSWRDADLAGVVLSRIEGDVGDTVQVLLLDGAGKGYDLALPLVEEKGEPVSLGPVQNVRVRLESRRLPGDIGYIAFNLFLHPGYLMPAYEEAIRSFMDADGVILDLRGNQGGMIPIGMGMAGWLVPEKDVYLGTMFFRDGQLKAVINPRSEIYEGPVAVLVDGLSISCAEAFAGGMQDIGRARVFGTRSAGMVLVSAIETLPNGDGFQYVFASYRSAKGELLEGRGVIPDVEAPPDRQALLRGEDPALAAARRWIEGQRKGGNGPRGAGRTGSR